MKQLKIKEAKQYSYYFIIYDNVDMGGIVASGSKGIYTTKYLNDDKDILIFYDEKEAKQWIKNHTYKGMTSKYDIKKIEHDKRWSIAA
jgi:proteasome assembly chaperone (PAC2) family protein